jgi:phage baseplate assembly protein W
MARVFSQEDGNLSTRSIITSRTKSYADIDLSFTRKPGTVTDIYKKTDAAAVKQSVKNILMTNRVEKPFLPYYGGNLNSFLFELADDELDVDEIQDVVAESISNFEPRALVRAVDVILRPDNNTINVTVKFQVMNTSELQEIVITLTRLR